MTAVRIDRQELALKVRGLRRHSRGEEAQGAQKEARSHARRWVVERAHS